MEEYITSIFRVEEKAKQETSMKQAGSTQLRSHNEFSFGWPASGVGGHNCECRMIDVGRSLSGSASNSRSQGSQGFLPNTVLAGVKPLGCEWMPCKQGGR
jgi:hypothetical protein